MGAHSLIALRFNIPSLPCLFPLFPIHPVTRPTINTGTVSGTDALTTLLAGNDIRIVRRRDTTPAAAGGGAAGGAAAHAAASAVTRPTISTGSVSGTYALTTLLAGNDIRIVRRRDTADTAAAGGGIGGGGAAAAGSGVTRPTINTSTVSGTDALTTLLAGNDIRIVRRRDTTPAAGGAVGGGAGGAAGSGVGKGEGGRGRGANGGVGRGAGGGGGGGGWEGDGRERGGVSEEEKEALFAMAARHEALKCSSTISLINCAVGTLEPRKIILLLLAFICALHGAPLPSLWQIERQNELVAAQQQQKKKSGGTPTAAAAGECIFKAHPLLPLLVSALHFQGTPNAAAAGECIFESPRLLPPSHLFSPAAARSRSVWAPTNDPATMLQAKLDVEMPQFRTTPPPAAAAALSPPLPVPTHPYSSSQHQERVGANQRPSSHAPSQARC
ncbi:unnamed protein product [Closterium sp. NIES-54]